MDSYAEYYDRKCEDVFNTMKKTHMNLAMTNTFAIKEEKDETIDEIIEFDN